MSDAGTEAATPETTEEAAPTDEVRQALLAEITSALGDGDGAGRDGDGVVESHLVAGTDLWIRVATESWVQAGRALHAHGFTFFSFLSGIDWMPSPYGRGEDDPTAAAPPRETEIKQGYAGGETRFQVFARLVDLEHHLGVTIKTDVPDDTMTVGSWVTIFAGANWHERETHEMFGINFEGHPDLRNIYLPGDFEGHPLRKDFPLLARMIKPWPGIVDVEPLPTEDEPDTDTPDGETVLHAPADESAVAAAEQTPDTKAEQEQQSTSEAQASETGDTA